MFKKYKLYTVISVCVMIAFIYAGISYCSEEQNNIPEWVKRISFGFDACTDAKTKIYFETVQPLYQDTEKLNTLFVQPRASIESGNGAYNLGLGYRRLTDDRSDLMGINTFFDYEDDDRHYRAGIGVELFLNLIEIRGNSYFGLSPRRVISETDTVKEYEEAVDGLDGEIGLPLPYLNWVKVFGGANWYNYEKFGNKEGWWVRTEFKPLKYSTINLISWDDNKGDPEFRVDARITIPFDAFSGKDRGKIVNTLISKQPYPEKADHSDRVLDRVEREYNIEVERWREGSGIIVEIRRGS